MTASLLYQHWVNIFLLRFSLNNTKNEYYGFSLILAKLDISYFMIDMELTECVTIKLRHRVKETNPFEHTTVAFGFSSFPEKLSQEI